MSILVGIGAIGAAVSTKNGHCAASFGREHHWGTMRGGGGGKIGGIGPGDKFSYTMGLRALMDHEGCHRPTAAMGPHSWR
jgi:hypothetical protein